MPYTSDQISKRTQAAYLLTRLLGAPFWGLANVLSIILYKDLHITPLQVWAIIVLKPMSALLAPYWSQAVYQRPDKVVPNLIWSNVIRYLPFLFMPWINSPWIIIFSFGLYVMLYRGVIPAWMEAVKCNLPEKAGQRLVATGSIIDYCGTAIIPLLFGYLLDQNAQAWRWLFVLTACLGLISTWFLYRLPGVGPANAIASEPTDLYTLFKEQIINPWKQSWQLTRNNRGFANFQIGFMLGGAGLMVMHPALPEFFVDVLNLSYTNLLLALTLAKGIGFALSSPAWIRLFRRVDIYYFCSLVTMLAGLFPFVLLCAQVNLVLLYVAYVLYGIMQGGSELGWHMSGPHFAKEKDSTIYSGTNVLTVGIRGCVAPALGAVLYATTNSTVVMLVGSLFCFCATLHFYRHRAVVVIPDGA